MAGRSGNMVRAQQAMNAAAYPNEIKDAKDIFGQFLPDAARKIVELADGASYQELAPDGTIKTLRLPPNLNALKYIMDRMIGTPRPEGAEIVDRLNTARAVFMEEQVIKGYIDSQVREVLSRAKLREVEASYWPKQFVTEDQQEKQIHALAEAMLTKLMSLTPDEYEAINAGREPGDALETLKGKIGRDLGEIIEEVMNKDDEEEADEPNAEDLDEEEDEDGV